MTIDNFIERVYLYFNQLDKLIEIDVNSPSWEEETDALENYSLEVRYYLPYFHKPACINCLFYDTCTKKEFPGNKNCFILNEKTIDMTPLVMELKTLWENNDNINQFLTKFINENVLNVFSNLKFDEKDIDSLINKVDDIIRITNGNTKEFLKLKETIKLLEKIKEKIKGE